jgi:hypothetical protein
MENFKSGNSCIEDLKNYNKNENYDYWKEMIFNITKWQNRLFTLLGVLLASFFVYNNFRKEKIYFFVALFIFYIIGTSGISCGQGDRFHLVTFPFVILLFGKILSETKRFKPFFEPLQK